MGSSTGWSLEVVRGADAGRTFPVGPGPCVLGNALNGEAGLDLGPQERESPRKMAPRQARLLASPEALTLSDLDSPGGTFVNRQRLLPGQSRALAPGDLIQLGGVQLKVQRPGAAVAAPAPEARPPGGPLTTPLTLAGGQVCRSWDDFLTASARDWSALRDELTSGRLERLLRSAGRSDLAPAAGASADERLDAWLGRLPTARPAAADLDVHPTAFLVRANAGGGVTRLKLRLTNTGYRLLRSTVRADASGLLTVGPEWSAAPFPTAEETEIPIDVSIPERVTEACVATLTVESNGGTRHVEVRIEPTKARGDGPEPAEFEGSTPFTEAAARWGAWSPGRRAAAAGCGVLGLRALLVVADSLLGPAATEAVARPTLRGPCVLLAGLGAAWVALRFGRRLAWREAVAGAFTGAVVGVLAAEVAVAVTRTVEGLAGPVLGETRPALAVLWGVAAAGAAFGASAWGPRPAHSAGAPPTEGDQR